MKPNDQGIERLGGPRLGLLGKSREEMIFDKQKLLNAYDKTKDAEP